MESGLLDELIEILEGHEDEQLANHLLSELTRKNSMLGKLIINLDPSLSSTEWKTECDKLKQEIDQLVFQIKALKR